MRFPQYAAGLIAVFAAVLLLFGGGPVGWTDENRSQCVVCHTSARTLIGITRELAKDPLRQPVVSLETVGEG